jgi:uncharacterized protein
VRMRDGVVLRGELLRPAGDARVPVLIYRTPYGAKDAVRSDGLYARAVERGYAVLVQNVRGRYESDGKFRPYQQEGKDGYDTIEWAAAQPWSSGVVGMIGLSYPAAAQWLAAIESPPHLRAMAPAMTFASPRQFFYSGGVFDGSWMSWIWYNIAPDERRKGGLAGPTADDEASVQWPAVRSRILGHLPLLELPDFRDVAPWYYDWLRHEPTDPWWEWAEIRGKYARTDAAVLNISGWHDEAYGPHGAITNFVGLAEARVGRPLRARLIVGPWPHGLRGMRRDSVGERVVTPSARMDYDETVLRWMDHHMRDSANGVDREPPVRVFVMGENQWREGDRWPLPGTTSKTFYLLRRAGLGESAPAATDAKSTFVSDPANPVTDTYAERAGAHDYRDLGNRPDVLTFETEPLEAPMRVIGAMTARIHLSSDAPDADLWVKVLDVAPDGSAFNLMSPGLDVIRASYRDTTAGRQLLEPRRVYELVLRDLYTANTFKRGHRVRVHLAATFFPNFSRNLHTGELETTSSRMRTARLTIHHDRRYPSRLIMPVVPDDSSCGAPTCQSTP